MEPDARRHLQASAARLRCDVCLRMPEGSERFAHQRASARLYGPVPDAPRSAASVAVPSAVSGTRTPSRSRCNGSARPRALSVRVCGSKAISR
jgi:hypothetical protein